MNFCNSIKYEREQYLMAKWKGIEGVLIVPSSSSKQHWMQDAVFRLFKVLAPRSP